MTWRYIREMLGPGLHWSKTQEQYKAAIERAEADGEHEAADHIRIILELRNAVMMENDNH